MAKKHDNTLKNKHNAHQITKTASQPYKTKANRIRKLKKRVRLNPNDLVAAQALNRALLQT